MSDAIDADLCDLVCLTMVPGVGPHTSRALMERFGTPTRVLDASPSALRDVAGVGPKLAERIARARRELEPEVELELCRQNGVRLVPLADGSYPRTLKRIHDPPPMLYM